MPATDRERDLHALRNLIEEAFTILDTIELPQGRANRAAKLLSSALSLTDDLIANPPAMLLGKLGGMKTAERGLEYFARIAAMRKKRSGGRPKAPPSPVQNEGSTNVGIPNWLPASGFSGVVVAGRILPVRSAGGDLL